ncbi:MAG: CHAT domain-containing protein [Hyphomicrobium sp.]
MWRLFAAKLDTTLKERRVKRDSRLVWLPSSWLGILPLGLAQGPPSAGGVLPTTTRLSTPPSLEALAAGNDVVAEHRRPTLAAAINPTGDLPGTDREGALVASYFTPADRSVLHGAAATPDAVLAALKGKSYWHFASHGTFAWLDPRNSALVMHDGEPLAVGPIAGNNGARPATSGGSLRLRNRAERYP